MTGTDGATAPTLFSAQGQVASARVAGDARITVTADTLDVTTPTGAASWPYPDVLGLSVADYTVVVRTTTGDVVVSRLGYDSEPFYQHLLRAYDDRVRQALFVSGAPLVRAHGHYAYDDGHSVAGTAPVEVHDDAVLVLPPDLGARRVPLCFVDAVEAFDFQLVLTLTTGERYTLSRLGYETDPVEQAVQTARQQQHATAVANVRELDPALSPDQATALARLLLAGVAAPFGRLAQVAPSFVQALEARLATTRAAETYQAFREMCDPEQICVGFTKTDPRTAVVSNGPDGAGLVSTGDGVPADLTGDDAGLSVESPEPGPEDGPQGDGPADPYRLWLIAPVRAGGATAVEFAGRGQDAAATFVYRHDGPGAAFAAQLNRALEAVAFAREPIRLDDDALTDPRYARYRMAVQRNTALQLVRRCLVARVVHRPGWRDTITTYIA